MTTIPRRSPKLPPNYGTQEVRDAIETLEDRPRISEKTPANSADDGYPGEIAADDSYIYIYTRGAGWKRAALTTF